MAPRTLAGFEDQPEDLRFSKAEGRYTEDRGVLIYPCQNCAHFIPPDQGGRPTDDPTGYCSVIGKASDPNGRAIQRTGTSALWRFFQSPRNRLQGQPSTQNPPAVLQVGAGQRVSDIYKTLPIPQGGPVAKVLNDQIENRVLRVRQRRGDFDEQSNG